MTTAYTSLLGLALPVTGELQGTWGDVVNDSITSLLDTAIAGTTSLTTDTDTTLSDTDGASNQSRQSIVLWNPASGTVTRNITAPARSKTYVVINATGGTQSIVFRGAGPTTGVTILAGEKAVVAWNGSDFVKISTFGGSPSFTNVTVTGTTTLSGLTASTALALNASKEVVSVTNTGTGNNVLSASPTLTGTVAGASLTLSSLTSGRVTYAGASGLLQDSANLTFNGTDLTVSGAVNAGSVNATTLDLTNIEVTNVKAKDGTSAATIADSTGVVSFTANPVMSGGTANGVTYLNGSKVLTSGSALTFDGYTLKNSAGNSGISIAGNAVLGLEDDVNAVISFNVPDANAAGLFFGYGGNPYWAGIEKDGANGLRLVSGGNMTFNTSGSEQMRLNTTGLGIGTSSPQTRLHADAASPTRGITAIVSASGSTGAQLQITQSGIEDWVIGQPAGVSAFAFWSGRNTGNDGVERMRLDSSGNLGLGVTPSAWGSSNAYQVGPWASLSSAGAYGTGLGFNTFFNGTNHIYSFSNFASMLQQSGGQFRFYTAASGTAGNAISFTQAMTLDASGNLGIGTSSPAVYTANSRLLQIDGGANAAELKLTNSTTGSAGADGTLFQLNGSAFYLWNLENSFLSFGTSNTERMRLDSSGNLGLGVTPSAIGGGRYLQFLSASSVGQQANGTVNLMNNAYESSGNSFSYIVSAGAARYNVSSDTHAWYTAPSGTAGNAISFTQAMTLDASGNLLVGTTTSPGSTNAQIVVGGTTDPGVQFASTSNGGGLILGNGGGGLGFYTYTGAIGLEGYTERARITSGGDFITNVNGTAPALSTNSTMSFELTSNTSLKIVVRGTDGVTRSVSLTLA